MSARAVEEAHHPYWQRPALANAGFLRVVARIEKAGGALRLRAVERRGKTSGDWRSSRVEAERGSAAGFDDSETIPKPHGVYGALIFPDIFQ